MSTSAETLREYGEANMAETVCDTLRFLPRAEVESRAREVLRRHHLTTVPIDPVVLANREGIKVNNAKFSDDNLVGMIVKRGDDVTMLVNFNDPPFRKRFTIAHELGHHFLHLMQDGEYVDKEANLFRQQLGEVVERDTPSRRQEIQEYVNEGHSWAKVAAITTKVYSKLQAS